ncbi:MAG: FlgD immunoglobulin-like domain containing protein [Rhodothermales bacterium]
MTSSPQAIWTLAHTQAGSFTVITPPNNRTQLDGIFDESASNPFSHYNRIWIAKCTPDRWLGNKAHHNLADFTTPLTVEIIAGACTDADENGTANCADNDFIPGSCDCTTRELAPPQSNNNEYSVYYHGKRIVRAVLADLTGGITTYAEYPLVDANGDRQADLRPGDEPFTLPDADSKIVFHCHSNGCNGLQGGHIDDLNALIDARLGADVDVRALFTGFLTGSLEAEVTVTEYDGIDLNPQDGIPDHVGDIDDSLSLYDHLIDDHSVTRQAMSDATYAPGGRQFQMLADWWDASMPDYDPPVDASCLAYHCPNNATGWENDPACTPCNESMHVLLNHLNTPFLYNQAQFDRVLGQRMNHCESNDIPPVAQPCDVEGDFTGVDLRQTHWRKLVRKVMADLFRSGDLDREEGGPGNEWPYNQLMLLAPDWAKHGPLSDLTVATKMLALPGTGGSASLAALAHAFVHQNNADAPRKDICLVERFPGENAFDFDDVQKGSIPVCTDTATGVATEPVADGLPAGSTLQQSYPNPFRTSTTITYDVEQPGPVTVTVYDALGRKVKTLVDAHQAVGSHAVVWDGREAGGQAVASGTYFYRLQVGEAVVIKQMVRVK